MLGAAALGAACDLEGSELDEPSGPGAGGKADQIEPADFACQEVDGIALEDLVDIDDPIAAFLVKRGTGCAADYRELVAQLAEIDPEGCNGDAGLVTRLVSDDARIDPNANNYRTVTTRNCGSRPPLALMWTLLSVRPSEDMGRRTFVEMQALDATTGLYDYWVFEGGRYRFVGNSLQARDRSIECGNCHRDGGVLMKELDDPWIHWEAEGRSLPGADAIFAAHGPLMGKRGDGRELETIVRAGNDVVIASRIEHDREPKAAAVRALLRPLFCSEQLNLDTGGTVIDAPLSSLTSDAFVDPTFGIASGFAVDPTAYTAAIAAAGQRVDGVPGRTDTELAYVFPERSGFEHAYLAALEREGIVDRDLVLDVLSIDFTRPLFSDARCGLLELVPRSLPAVDPDTIRKALQTAIADSKPADGTPAATLALHLADSTDAEAHTGDVAAFLAACDARDDRAMLDDLLRYTQLTRDLVRRTTSLIEHPEQMPTTKLMVADAAHLDPKTCELR